MHQGSLSYILRENAIFRPIVSPIYWTDIHTELLGAEFVELAPCSEPSPDIPTGLQPSKGHLHPSETIKTLIRSLNAISSSAAEHRSSIQAVQTVVETFWPGVFERALFRSTLPIYFGGRIYRDQIKPHIMWNHPARDSASHKHTSTGSLDLPMLCYMSRSQRVQDLNTCKTPMPANPDRDAFFVAIFLAMAQQHVYGTPPLLSRDDSRWSAGPSRALWRQFKDVKLRLLSYDNETKEFLVYTAYVTAEFLERFHRPDCIPRNDKQTGPSIRIEYTRVPIWPLLGLRERLGKALGEDMVGSFNAEDMCTWLDEEKEGVTSSTSSMPANEGSNKGKAQADYNSNPSLRQPLKLSSSQNPTFSSLRRLNVGRIPRFGL